MLNVVFQSASRPLFVAHALLAFALLFACTHQAIVSVQLVRGRAHLARLARFYARVIGALFPLAFGVGLLMYPHFRYHVRGLFLDRYQPWASNLFDIKENLVALGVPLALVLFAVGRDLEPSRDRPRMAWLAFASIALWALVAFGSISGIVVTRVRGV